MSALDRDATIARIVLDHPECARVFRDRRIDFCCRGDVTLEQACAARGLDVDVLAGELEQAIRERARDDADPRSLSTPELIASIVTRHHDYLRTTLPFVEQLARKVARVHERHDEKLPLLADAVSALGEMLEEHLDDEERALFPMLVAANPHESSGAIRRQLRAMHEEHLRVAQSLGRVRLLASDYALPDWACMTYRTLMRELEAVEADTFTHVHTENHVLMPRFAGGTS